MPPAPGAHLVGQLPSPVGGLLPQSRQLAMAGVELLPQPPAGVLRSRQLGLQAVTLLHCLVQGGTKGAAAGADRLERGADALGRLRGTQQRGEHLGQPGSTRTHRRLQEGCQ